jgi:methylmalonyl-CoA/ethylmalonyl-CoA epimerase
VADDGLAGVVARGRCVFMSALRFDHIGLVVRDMAEGREFLGSVFGIDRWTEVFEDAGIGVYVQFGRADNGPCYELISPRGDESPVAGVLKGGRNILNHVAYLTDDLDAEGEKLRDLACGSAGPAKAAVAYGGKRVQFWMSPLRFMIELVEAPGHEHAYKVGGA